MAKADRWSGFFWIFFGLFTSYESYRLGLGSLYQPGPGFLFFWTGIVVALLALVVVVKAFMAAPEEAGEGLFKKASVAKVVFVLLALFLYAVLIERIGFIIVTLLLFLFLLSSILSNQPGKISSMRYEFIVYALFRNFALVHTKDAVRSRENVKLMCNENSRFVCHDSTNAFLE